MGPVAVDMRYVALLGSLRREAGCERALSERGRGIDVNWAWLSITLGAEGGGPGDSSQGATSSVNPVALVGCNVRGDSTGGVGERTRFEFDEDGLGEGKLGGAGKRSQGVTSSIGPVDSPIEEALDLTDGAADRIRLVSGPGWDSHGVTSSRFVLMEPVAVVGRLRVLTFGGGGGLWPSGAFVEARAGFRGGR